MEYQIFCDGGARGNPGPAASATIIKNFEGQNLAQISRYLGLTTNNVAEYSAVISALEWFVQNTDNERNIINFFLDSELVVKQLNGFYKIKNSNLKELVFQIKSLENKLNANIKYNAIPREKNKEADLLVNQVLNNHQKPSN